MVNRFMGIGDTGCGIGGHERSPINMAADRQSSVERLRQNRVATFIPFDHLNEIHLFTESDRLRPTIEDGAYLRRIQVSPGGFQSGMGGRNRTWDGQKNIE